MAVKDQGLRHSVQLKDNTDFKSKRQSATSNYFAIQGKTALGALKKQVTLNEKMMKDKDRSLIMSPPKTMEQTPKKAIVHKSLGGEEL